MIIRTHAHASVGLLGTPSGRVHGKAVALVLPALAADITLYESPRLAILPGRRDHLVFPDRHALLDDVRLNGYHGGIRVLKATISAFSDYCRTHDIELSERNFTLEYATGIPTSAGLGGSSALTLAALRALLSFYGVALPEPVLPGFVRNVLADYLGDAAEMPGAVAQVYGGPVFVDLEQAHMERQGRGRYERLNPEHLPPLFVAYYARPPRRSAPPTTAPPPTLNEDAEEALHALAGYAQRTRDLIVADRGAEIAPLLDASLEAYRPLARVDDATERLLRTGRQHEASVTVAPGARAVVGLFDGDPERLSHLRRAYEEIGAELAALPVQAAAPA